MMLRRLLTIWALLLTALPVSAQAPTWIHHVVIPWERLVNVAERYGVSSQDVLEWNGLDRDKTPLIRSGQTLKILARKFPAPRQQMSYVVAEHDSWKSISRRYGHSVKQVQRWNPRSTRKGLQTGEILLLWMDSSLPGLGSGVVGPTPPSFRVQPGGMSRGRPDRGKLVNGVRLPESPHYRARIAHQAYGTSLAVLNIQKAIAVFRHRSGYTGQLVIGALSREGGRKLPPHRSHQSGRDVDVWLPAMPHARRGRKPDEDEVDWHASWFLIRAFVDTGVVHRIYLDRNVFKRLRVASKELGVSWEEFSAIVNPAGIVRHNTGHLSHIHVRFICSLEAPRCRT